jgi:hypothetical protein
VSSAHLPCLFGITVHIRCDLMSPRSLPDTVLVRCTLPSSRLPTPTACFAWRCRRTLSNVQRHSLATTPSFLSIPPGQRPLSSVFNPSSLLLSPAAQPASSVAIGLQLYPLSGPNSCGSTYLPSRCFIASSHPPCDCFIALCVCMLSCSTVLYCFIAVLS